MLCLEQASQARVSEGLSQSGTERKRFFQPDILAYIFGVMAAVSVFGGHLMCFILSLLFPFLGPKSLDFAL